MQDEAHQSLAILQHSGLHGSEHSNAALTKEPVLTPRSSGVQRCQNAAEDSDSQGDASLLYRMSSLQNCRHEHELTARPSFMRPTVSSLVHTASRQRSLRKSQSAVEV